RRRTPVGAYLDESKRLWSPDRCARDELVDFFFQAEDGIRDDAAELAFTGAVFHAGGEHHVFFNQNAADVVRTELQADLADFYSRGEPARLDVINVVEIQPADRERFQIIDSRGLLHFFAERGIFRGEHPRDKRGEPAGIFLN